MLSIQPFTIDCYDEVYALWASTPGIGLRSLDDSREGIAKYLARNPSTSFCAYEDGQLLGVIMAGHDGRRGYIHHTLVRETARGRGVGRALVQAAEEALRQEGINKVALVAFQTNEKGNAFWERMGYTARPDLTYRNRSLNDANR